MAPLLHAIEADWILESKLVSRVTTLVVASTIPSTLVTRVSSALVSELLMTVLLVGVVLVLTSILVVVQITRSLLGLVMGTHLVVLVHTCDGCVR